VAHLLLREVAQHGQQAAPAARYISDALVQAGRLRVRLAHLRQVEGEQLPCGYQIRQVAQLEQPWLLRPANCNQNMYFPCK
jgi:hypothetical protein